LDFKPWNIGITPKKNLEISMGFISGWWCNVPILKNDGVRKWEGWHPIYIYTLWLFVAYPWYRWPIEIEV
jgi:hypothetical protein